jgi:hypothetical protein
MTARPRPITRQRAELAFESMAELGSNAARWIPFAAGPRGFDECPIVTTARANVAGTRVQPPGLDAKCPFGSDEVATAGKP